MNKNEICQINSVTLITDSEPRQNTTSIMCAYMHVWTQHVVGIYPRWVASLLKGTMHRFIYMPSYVTPKGSSAYPIHLLYVWKSEGNEGNLRTAQ